MEGVGGEEGMQHAGIVFTSASAWQTALLLTNARVGGSTIQVQAYGVAFPQDVVEEEEPEAETASSETGAPPPSSEESPAEGGGGEDVPQERKRKTAIMAELTASGYMLGANTLARARKFDEEHFNLGLRMQVGVEITKNKVADIDRALGISAGVGSAVQTTTAAARAVDERLGVSSTVAAATSATVGVASSAASAVAAAPGVRHVVTAASAAADAVSSSVSSYTAATAAEVAARQADQAAPSQAVYGE